MTPERRLLRTVAVALFVCAAYYVGARIGFLLQLPAASTSVLWPPNAILTATLLLTPVRRWWIYILAVLPAHLFVQLGVVEPRSLVAAWFVTNCSEALIAAMCVRAFSDASARFDTLRRMAVFIIGAGVVAPFVSSFLDAAAVAMLRGEAYWLVWRTRFFANVVTELTLVPAIVMLVNSGGRWLVATSTRRRIEALLLVVSLVIVGSLVFRTPVDGYPSTLGSPWTPLAFLLPFLLWAAVRFGPTGASLSLLSTALLAVLESGHGPGPFTVPAPGETVLALQIFLGVIAIPLLCLSAAIQERRHTESALNERLRFEELLSRLSSAFVHVPADEMDEAIQVWLGRLGDFLGLDRLTLLRLSEDRESLAVLHSWAAAGIDVLRPGTSSRAFPEAVRRLLADAAFVFSGSENGLTARAGEERLGRDTVQSNLTIPLLAGGRVLGAIVLDSVARSRIWPGAIMPQLRLVAEVFGSALARKDAEQALRGSESMKSAILGSLTTKVAVLDRAGLLVTVNEQWTRHACERGVTSTGLAVGSSYLDAWRRAEQEGRPHAGEALTGIAAVLAGTQRAYSVEYPCSGAAGEQWWAMSVVPLTRPEGGAVVSQTDVTERKRVEIEAQRARQELAHSARVSTMGELTASLAHELNQPLTGILANAHAARRFLDTTPVDLDELRAILGDIIEDDQRASSVIHRLRDLLLKREPELGPVDMNELIRDVVRLLGSDALIRNVTLAVDLAPELPMISGDRVQLQQVVLNLIVNAMDAMSDGAASNRTITVRTENLESIHVSVRDEGLGLRSGTHDLIFEPFYTTKAAGMGMGLAIARSIVEAHAGLIWVTDNPTRGATFHFALPTEGEQAA